MLVLAAAGLLWRMIFFWALAVFLLVIAVGIAALQDKWGGTLIIQVIFW